MCDINLEPKYQIPDRIDYFEILIEQIWILSEWNKTHINDEPEQVRLNVDTISSCVRTLNRN